ncbi:SCO family protein [Egicoccus sp. AB-alg2]|uniref:SCO family protein n=1 Tax=Egicoccus sp. AB-alg2 TaxID=3242693 RepID=UPI00359E2A72
MTLRRLLLPLLALAVFVTACEPTTATAISAQGLQRQPDGWRGVPLEVEREMPDVTLLDTSGDEVDLREATEGTPTLLFFGYTSCPDICPIHLAVLSAAMREVGVTTEQVQVLFVSVDPERDTPERIDDYLANFDTRFVGLHGDLEVVEDALRQLDLPGPVVEGPDPRGEGDLIGHPAQMIGFDADGQAQRVWPFGARRSDWVFDLPGIVEEWSRETDA